MDQVLGRRGARAEVPLDRLGPEVRPGRPRRDRQVRRGPGREGRRPLVVAHLDRVDRDRHVRQGVHRRRPETVEPDLPGQERGQVGPPSRGLAVRVAGDQHGGGNGRTLRQPAADRLADDPQLTVRGVRVPRVEPAQDRRAGRHRDAPDRVRDAAGDPLGAEDLLPEGVSTPAPDPVGQHGTSVREGAAAEQLGPGVRADLAGGDAVDDRANAAAEQGHPRGDESARFLPPIRVSRSASTASATRRSRSASNTGAVATAIGEVGSEPVADAPSDLSPPSRHMTRAVRTRRSLTS